MVTQLTGSLSPMVKTQTKVWICFGVAYCGPDCCWHSGNEAVNQSLFASVSLSVFKCNDQNNRMKIMN